LLTQVVQHNANPASDAQSVNTTVPAVQLDEPKFI